MPILWTSDDAGKRSYKALLDKKQLAALKRKLGSAIFWIPEPWRTIAVELFESDSDLLVTIEPYKHDDV